eukprot:TRINITY_DN6911_c1_g1_i1.p1 TRINITY_DN6911_c1_g1~~TRINITY_DN6911_c1_g1_i1.p1  ORF type:complete len:456 (-),score=49.16 TRINITY_DN6911_c1_g1_i1:707-2074(-)
MFNSLILPFSSNLNCLATSRLRFRGQHNRLSRQGYQFLQIRMVEGHQCHRLAYAHKKLLLGHAFKATSPNKRFEEGAGAINGVPLDRIEVHGKNMFYFFGPTVVHIHFGMSGQFKTVLLDHAPEPTPTTRLALVNEDINMAAFLSAMTVQHGPISELYDKKIKQLGPDPLRDDANPTRFWEKLKKSKQPIGKILMDQSCIAGLGNIYRAEVLFKTGVHPEQPGTTITEEVYEKLWKESVWCLQRGFQKGSILTVNPGENLGKPWTRRYVYNHKKCGRCNSSIKSWDIATRRVYACLTCQPLLEAELEESRKKALAEAGVPILFASRCAADAPEDKLPEQMTVKELQDKLQQAGQQTNGTKTELIRRLSIATQQSDASSSDELDDLGIDMKILDVAPGTKQIEKVATAKEAAQEKQEAGENRAVEHIALIIDEQLEKKSFQSNSKSQGKKTITQNS